MNINFKQSGVSLISLMVGMAISLMTLAAASILFQQTYKISNTLANDAISEGALSTVLAELQMATLNAGFGMSDTINPHFVVKPGDSIAYWRYDLTPEVAGTTVCKGFKEFVNAGQLEFQWLTVSCTNAEDLLELTWVPEGVSTILQKQSTSRLEFSQTSEACWPHADGDRNTHILFTIKVVGGVVYEHNYCLVNT